MKPPKHRWTPLLLAAALLAGCSGSDADTSDDNSITNHDDDASISEGEWDGERDRLESLDLPVHEVVIDGEDTYSEYGQEQWDLYNDGDVSREAYEQAFLNFAACVEDNDGWINYLDLDDEQITYTTTDGSDPDQYCYYTHFGLIDMEWQINHPEDVSEEIQYYIDCLTKENIDPHHDEAVKEPGDDQLEQLDDLWEQAQENNANCEYRDPSFDELHEDE